MTQLLIKRFIKHPNDVHNTAVRTAYGKLAGTVGIVCNVLLCALKLVVGTLSGSISITADAVNNLSDASSSVITLIGFKLSARPADEEHPYGHARIEYIAGLAVAIMILIIGLELARTGIDKILHPTPVEFSAVLVLVLVLSILTKLWMMYFNRTIGKRIGSGTLQATAADSRNDVITTAVVLAAAVVARLTNINLDGMMGLA
ncbi:MAG: cation diffusion facilitator family transporter, partial [Ruthenibacterium sp.]